MDTATLLISLIIFLPLAGFLINGLMGLSSTSFREKKGLIGTIANLTVFIPFVIAVYFYLNMGQGSEPIIAELFTWFNVGSFHVDVAYQIYQLSMLMTMLVTGVGLWLIRYSLWYLSD